MPHRLLQSNRTVRLIAGLLACALAAAALLAAAGCSGLSTGTPWLSEWREQRDQAAEEHQVAVADGVFFEEATVVRVVDGDTIVVELDGEQAKVRFIGVDAPESVAFDSGENTAEGDAASEHLKELLAPGTRVFLCSDKRDTDRYGRLLRHVWLEVPDDPFDIDEVAGKMVGGMMVRDGYAVSKRYTPDTTWSDLLDQIEAQAREQGRGAFGQPDAAPAA